MSLLDRPISKRGHAALAYLGLGFAAWILGHRVGMDALESIAFTLATLLGIAFLVDSMTESPYTPGYAGFVNVFAGEADVSGGSLTEF